MKGSGSRWRCLQALPLPANSGAGAGDGGAGKRHSLPDEGDAASEHGEGQGTFLSSVITLSAWAMGCGVLALPHVFAICGQRWGLALLAIFALWVDLTLRWTVACGRYSGKHGFKENTQFFLGLGVARLVHWGQVVLLFGGIVAIFLTAASLLACSAQEVLASLCSEEPPAQVGLQVVCRVAHPAPCVPRGRMLVLVALLVFPMACQKSLHALRGISTLGLGCMAYFFIVLLLRVVSMGRALAAGDSPWAFPAQDGLSATRAGSFWQGPPVVLMSFLCHTSILQLDAELRPQERLRIGGVIDTVVMRTALPVYAVVGLGGYWLCGPGVSSNVLEEFGADAWMAGARLLLGLMNVGKVPMATVALREALVSSLPSLQMRRRLRRPGGRALSSAAVLACGAATAAAMGSLSRVLSLLGCTVGVLFSLCLPATLYGRLLWDLAARRRGGAGGRLQEPLLGAPDRAALVAGALVLPQTAAGWVAQSAACVAVFVGGLLVGGLGLAGWLSQTGG